MLIHILFSIICLHTASVYSQSNRPAPSELEQFLRAQGNEFKGFDKLIHTMNAHRPLIAIEDLNAHVEKPTPLSEIDYEAEYNLFIKTAVTKDGKVSKIVSVGDEETESISLLAFKYTQKQTLRNNATLNKLLILACVATAGVAGYHSNFNHRQLNTIISQPSVVGGIVTVISATTGADIADSLNQQSLKTFNSLSRDGRISSDDLYRLLDVSKQVNVNQKDESDSIYYIIATTALPLASFALGAIGKNIFTKSS
jgi:hypothetical protein